MIYFLLNAQVFFKFSWRLSSSSRPSSEASLLGLACLFNCTGFNWTCDLHLGYCFSYLRYVSALEAVDGFAVLTDRMSVWVDSIGMNGCIDDWKCLYPLVCCCFWVSNIFLLCSIPCHLYQQCKFLALWCGLVCLGSYLASKLSWCYLSCTFRFRYHSDFLVHFGFCRWLYQHPGCMSLFTKIFVLSCSILILFDLILETFWCHNLSYFIFMT